MKLNEIILSVFLMTSIFPVIATTSFSGNFYNSESSYGLSESCDNAYSSGSITLLPSDGFLDYPFSLKATNSGGVNGGSADSKHSGSVTASGKGKTVSTESTLEEDAALHGLVSSTWGHEVTMGGQNRVNVFTIIASIPGYLTDPTAPGVDSVSTGMTFEAKSEGQLLFEKKYIPPPEFGDFPLVLGVVKSPLYPDVYMENKLEVVADW